LPEEAAARLEVDAGSGSFDPGDSFELVSGEPDDDSAWETPGFGQAEDRVILEIDQGSGNIHIQNP
jgi:hypothetical protein